MLKAALFLGPDSLRFDDIAPPQIGNTQALVRVKVCTIDGAARAILRGKMPPRKTPPMVLGTQICGQVERIGSGVRTVRQGDRVHVSAHTWCGTCFYCQTGLTNLCENIKLYGIDIDGGFEEYLAAEESALFRLPDQLPDEESSLLTADLCTAFHAVSRARVEVGDVVAVFGTGGLGDCLIQIASKLRGARVIAIGRNAEQLRLAASLGASDTVNTLSEDPVRRIKELTRGKGADVAFEAVGIPEIMGQAVSSLRSGGRAIILGASKGVLSVEIRRLFREEVMVIGSNNSVPNLELPLIIDQLLTGRLSLKESVKHSVRFDEIVRGFDLLDSSAGTIHRVCVRIG